MRNRLVKGVQVPVKQNIADIILCAVEAEECRRSLNLFVQQAWPFVDPAEYVHGWHIESICEHLEAVSKGQITRLLINMPPRHMKSSIVSVMWPMWDWITHPERRWMFSSYALSLALRDSLKSRRLVESDWYQKRYSDIFKLAEDQNAKSRFENDKGGMRLAVSCGSAATGEGGDIIVCDDPHNVIEAESDVIRQGTLDWWDTTMSSRLNNPKTGAKVIVMQRLHSEDLAGHVLARDEYVHLRLPAEFEPFNKCFTSIGWEDPRTYEGELLWPERIDAKVIVEAKRSLGSYGYAGQFQQSPSPAGGGYVKREWMRYYEDSPAAYLLEVPGRGRFAILKSACSIFATVDLAISSKQSADYTVIALWAMTPQSDLILFDLIRAHMDNPEQQRAIEMVHMRYRPDYIYIESVAYQLSLVQQMLARGVPAREYRPVKDKVSRFTSASIWYENGKIYHPKYAPWLADFEDELLKFDRGTHDDQADVTSMAAEQVISPRIPLSGDETADYAMQRVDDRAPPSVESPSRISAIDQEIVEIQRQLTAMRTERTGV